MTEWQEETVITLLTKPDMAGVLTTHKKVVPDLIRHLPTWLWQRFIKTYQFETRRSRPEILRSGMTGCIAFLYLMPIKNPRSLKDQRVM